LEDDLSDTNILCLKPHPPGRNKVFYASWIRPTQQEVDEKYPAGIPLDPKVLKYYEDIDVIEAEDVMLEFLSPHDREEFKRIYRDTKKAWHDERMLLKDDVPVNVKPGSTPQPPDGVGSPPIPPKKARMEFSPRGSPGSQSASSTVTQSRHDSTLEESGTVAQNPIFLTVPQSRPFGGPSGPG
jgi:hypothetical protein